MFHSSRNAGLQRVTSHFMISNIILRKCLQPRLDTQLTCKIQQRKCDMLIVHVCPFACMYDRYCISDLRKYVCLSVDIQTLHTWTYKDLSVKSRVLFRPQLRLSHTQELSRVICVLDSTEGDLQTLDTAFTYLGSKYLIFRVK